MRSNVREFGDYLVYYSDVDDEVRVRGPYGIEYRAAVNPWDIPYMVYRGLSIPYEFRKNDDLSMSWLPLNNTAVSEDLDYIYKRLN